MAHARCKPFFLSASGVVASQSSHPQSVTLHSMILSETAGTTNETAIFYIPTPSGDGSTVPVASASGTKVGEVMIPKGTTVVVPELCGMYFENGLYIALAGGTPAVLLGID